MRLVYIPENLIPFDLLELREISALLAERLESEVRRYSAAAEWTEALASVDTLFEVAWDAQDRYTAAIVLLYKAEILRRTQRWGEAQELIQRASNWLRIQITQVAAYNHAVALYFAGLIHFVQSADAKTMGAFEQAQNLLVESERYWGFENNRPRVIACQELAKWMSHLLRLTLCKPTGQIELIVPVYERVNQTAIRTGAMVVTPFKVLTPSEALAKYLPPNYAPVDIETLPLSQLRSDAQYLAVKIPDDAVGFKRGQAGDVLLIEKLPGADPTSQANLSRTTAFVRRMDGRILFGPYERADGPEGEPPRVIGGRGEQA